MCVQSDQPFPLLDNSFGPNGGFHLELVGPKCRMRDGQVRYYHRQTLKRASLYRIHVHEELYDRCMLNPKHGIAEMEMGTMGSIAKEPS
jgi:hypothetical protein